MGGGQPRDPSVACQARQSVSVAGGLLWKTGQRRILSRKGDREDAR